MKTILKPLLLLLIFTMSSQIVNAQAAILAMIFGDKVASENFNMSLLIGGNLSNVSNIDDSKTYFGLNFGLGCNIKLNEKLYLTPEFKALDYRGFKLDSYSLNSGNTQLDDLYQNKELEVELSYISIPVVLYYRVSEKIKLGVGPQISFLTNATANFASNDNTLNYGIKDYTESIDYGVCFDVSYTLYAARKGKGLAVHARYYQGIEDVFQNTEAFPIFGNSNKSSYFAITLDFPFLSDELAAKNAKPKEKS